MAAAAGQGQAPNMDLFDSYFRRADLDQDGRISGQEAVAFFQGSNLPQQVLAQIWTYADQNRASFLGRPEFYNALKLVTVAQSGRQLTPEIVKAALYGPAASKIPAPQINFASTPAVQMNSLGAPRPQLNAMARPSSPMGVAATASQNLSFRGPQENASLGMNQQFFPSPDNNSMRPSQATPSPAAFPVQVVNRGPSASGSVAGPRLPSSIPSNLSTDWFSSRTTGASLGGVSQGSVRGVTPSTNQDRFGLGISGPGAPSTPRTISSPSSSLPPKPLDQVLPSSQPAANNSRALAISGNGFPSDSVFGGDVFTAASQSKPDTSSPSFSAGNMANLSGVSSVASGYQNAAKTGQFDSLTSSSVVSQGVSQLQQNPSLSKQNSDTLQGTSTLSASSVSVGPVASASGQPQLPWPKIIESNIQKYTTVFVEVDKDRDGKITGEQARNLFLSWKLPREVLKQVWDLSDQDNDSMLSLREFCIALYLMERFREGRPLPAVLPDSVKFDETLLRATPQPTNTYSGPTWKPNPGLPPQGIPGARPPLPVPGIRPNMHSPFPVQTDGSGQTVQPRSRGPLENHLINRPGKEEPNALNPAFQEASEPAKKEVEKEILDSREKMEFYRTKMQELVLYKSRCDNRLNEITERASADKREAETLAKRYEEKYKQVGEIASKLTVEEAAFRHVQERKLELENAIVKMQQGGSADGLLQVRADRIQSDLEELMKALNERSKHFGLHVKPAAMIELPFGWQPGIQGEAAEWNEDWDKFEDEGFAIVKDFTVDFDDDDVSTVKPKSPSSWSDKVSDEFSPVADKKGKLSSIGDQINETESAYDQSEEGLGRSPSGSPGRNVFESPRNVFENPSHSTEFGIHDVSPHAKGSHSDHGGGESNEPSWSFDDGNDDVDSVWGFSTTNTKEADYDSKQNSFFDSGDFGLNPLKMGSPSAGSTFGKEKTSFFADSVPSTPLFNSGVSPKFNDGPEDHSFNTFSRFDSFNTNDNQRENFTRFDSMRSTGDAGLFNQRDNFARIDSMRSTGDAGLFNQRENFARFDSMRSTVDYDRKQVESFSRFDSMRSSAEYDRKQVDSFSRFDSMRSTADFDQKHGETLARFDSMRSTVDFDRSRGFPSFDDADPFGSTGPFKPLDNHSPRKGSDSWSAF